MYAGFYDLIWVWCSCKCSYTVYKHNCFGKMGGRGRTGEERREEKKMGHESKSEAKKRGDSGKR